MKATPSTYDQMVSYLTEDGQIDIFSTQLAARQCYQVALEYDNLTINKPQPNPSNTEEKYQWLNLI